MKPQKILLVFVPPVWPKMPPIGLGFLQSYVRKNGFQADILDLNNIFYRLSDDALKKKWLISCNTQLERNIITIISERYGAEFHGMIEKILTYDVVGFSCFKSNAEASAEIAHLVKSRRKDIRIIFGGPEMARRDFKAGGTYKDDRADFIVVGEGERPLIEFLREERDDEVARFEQLDDLSSLPFPTYEGLSLKNYTRHDAVPLQLSRGCVRRCAFCSERLLYKGFRARSVASVIEEIHYHKERNDVRSFVFFDSMINADLKRLDELCEAIIKNFGSVNWEAQIGVRPDMGEKLLEKMKRSGCYNLFVGLESGSAETLKRMNKGFTKEEAADFFQRLADARLSFGVSIIIGYPGETEADFDESLEFLLRNRTTIKKIEQINPFTYYDGTDADRAGDYRVHPESLGRLERFTSEVKRHGFKYTNAFIGNLIEK